MIEGNGTAIKTRPDYFDEVNQDSNIFHNTLRFTLTLGRDFTDEQINHAITGAGLTKLVDKIGLDSVIKEDGVNLSGGKEENRNCAGLFFIAATFNL